MKGKYLLFACFLIVALAQLYVPAEMIWGRERVLAEGRGYKFRTAPIDPYDPFRGKYVTLRFAENRVEVNNSENWLRGEDLYVVLKKDEHGFMAADSITKEKPVNAPDFVKAKVDYVSSQYGENVVFIEYPFDRFYMEESKAKEAEDIYRESTIDTNQVAYALVSIKDGDAVLKDVYINDVPLKEVVLKERNK